MSRLELISEKQRRSPSYVRWAKARDRVSVAAAFASSLIAWVIIFVAGDGDQLARLIIPFALTLLLCLLVMYSAIFIRWRRVGPATSARTRMPASARRVWRNLNFWRLGLFGACLMWLTAGILFVLLGWASASFFNAAMVIIALLALLDLALPAILNILWVRFGRDI